MFTNLDEILNENDPEETYRRRQGEEKTSISWGQRKLLLTLVSFLSKHLDKETKDPIILYSGAAPGVNIGIVATLFPEVTFHLYDPSPFMIKTNLDKKIIIYQKKFTDSIAEFWAEKQKKNNNIYFISDIRTADHTKAKDLTENEDQILKDMEMQRKWVEIIKPIKSHLKFRPNYTGEGRKETLEYFDGIIYKQSFAPESSTETRLVVSNLVYKTYSCEKYQSQMFYHNSIIREKNKYENDCMDEPELLNDYDSCCEVLIWKDYLKNRGLEVTKEAVIKLSRNATYLLTDGRKYRDTLEYLRSNPRAIKDRNFKRKDKK